MIEHIEFINIFLLSLLPFIILYLLFKTLIFCYKTLQFSFLESMGIIIGSIILTIQPRFFGFNIGIVSLFSYHNWDIAVHTCGFLIPIFLCVLCFKKSHIDKVTLLLGIMLVSLSAYLFTIPVPSKGIVSPFPFFLLPSLTAAIIPFVLPSTKKMEAKDTAIYCYMSAVIGVFIGADLLHLPTLLLKESVTPMYAIIGGAAAWDMIYLSGIVSIVFYQVLHIFILKVKSFEIHRPYNYKLQHV